MRPTRLDLAAALIVGVSAAALVAPAPTASALARAIALLVLAGAIVASTRAPALAAARLVALGGLALALVVAQHEISGRALLGGALAAAAWVLAGAPHALGPWAALGVATLADAIHPGTGTIAFGAVAYLRAREPLPLGLAFVLAAATPPWGITLALQWAALALTALVGAVTHAFVMRRGLREGPQRVILLFAALAPGLALAAATVGLTSIQARLPAATPTMIFTFAGSGGVAAGIVFVGYALALATTHAARALLIAAPLIALGSAALIHSSALLFLLAPAGVALTLGLASLSRLLPERARGVLLPRDKPL